MKNYNKIAILFLLLITTLSFSGCSVKKVKEKKEVVSSPESKEPQKSDIDTDGDGLFDSEEKVYGTDVRKSDTDNDGLSDFQELRNWKTNPLIPDTDGDGYTDGQEVEGGYDPTGLEQLDSDRDGLGDADEIKVGTNPQKSDTDGDGFSDKDEIDSGTDPLVSEVK